MRRILPILLIVMMSIVTACGGDSGDTSGDASGNNADQEQTPEVTFTVTGSVETEAEGNASLFCDDGDGITDPFIEIGFFGDGQLDLTVLPDASGTVALLGSDEPDALTGQANYVDYRSEDRVNYQLGSGELVIENMPTAEGEMFIATMTAELSDDDGNTINIEASYNVTAGTQAFDDCN